jgi:glycosyltransferase involved in cell wall biosynthesis
VSAAGANSWPLVSVVVPARNEPQIARVVRAVLGQSSRAASVEVVVVDDGSSDETAQRAEAAGARVVRLRAPGEPGNAAAARNHGFLECRGDPVVFLDGDCIPESGWLDRILEAHEHGAGAVGGSLSLPPGLPIVARCDYYCGWYVIHPAATAGWVPHHPPPNLSVRRAAYAATGGFAEQPPFSFSNEERCALPATDSISSHGRWPRITTARVSVISCGETTAGPTPPWKRSRRRARPVPRGSIGTPGCW